MKINHSFGTISENYLKRNENNSVPEQKPVNKLPLNKINFALAETMKANVLFKGYKSESLFLQNENFDSLKFNGIVTLSGLSSVEGLEAKSVVLRNSSTVNDIKAQEVVELQDHTQVTGEIIFTKDKGKVVLYQDNDGKYPYIDPYKVKNGEIVVREFIKGYDYDDLWEHFDQLGDSYGEEEPFNPEIHKLRKSNSY